MLDHTKPYVEKIHNIDATLAWHVGYINLTWNDRVYVGVAFFCLLCACLPNLTTLEWIDQQHIAKTKVRCISLPSNLNTAISIKSYYCVILKMVILHDAIKTIQNRFLCFFLKKEQKHVFSKKWINEDMWIVFFKPGFFNPDYLSTLFRDFSLMARSRKVTSLPVWLVALRTPKV